MAQETVKPAVTTHGDGEEFVNSGDELPGKQRSESTYPDPEGAEAKGVAGDAARREEEEAEKEAEKEKAGGEKAKPKPKQKVKLGEEEFDEDDLKDAIEVRKKRKEHLRAANKRFEETAEYHEKEIRPIKALLEQIKKDPAAAFELIRKAGGSPDDAVAKYAEKYVEQEKLTPEQRALKQQEAELARRSDDLQQKQDEFEQEQHDREVAKYRETFKMEVSKVLPKFDLPDDPITVGEIAKTVAGQIRAGMDPDYESAAEMEAERVDELVVKHLDRLSRTPGALAKKYPELAKRLREEDVAAAITPLRKTTPSGKPATRPALQEEKPKIKSWEDEETELRRKRYGLAPRQP